MQHLGKIFLESSIKRLEYYKQLGDKTFSVLDTDDFYYTPEKESNSIAVIIQHVSGNMLSRWTNFLDTDGEKEWRNRDTEFDGGDGTNKRPKEALIDVWEKGWACCLDALKALEEKDLLKTVHIRNEPLTVTDAINRQLAHYPYHVGQLIYIAKMIKGVEWQSLSIPKKQS